jgi:hypothetical protein
LKIQHIWENGKSVHMFFSPPKIRKDNDFKYTGVDEKVILKRVLVNLCCGVKSAATLLVCWINFVNTVTILRFPYKLGIS